MQQNSNSSVENGHIIDKNNFSEHFFDVRRFKPQKGQVMAKFSAIAVFGEGPEKRDIINLLKKNKAESAAAVMRKIHCAAEPDCYRVCREICEDLLSGMTEEEVEKKEHEFLLESFFYTKKENVPKDKHWSMIEIIRFDRENNTFLSEYDI